MRILVACMSLAVVRLAADPLAAELDGKAPEILRELPPPSDTPGNVIVRRVVFRSRERSEIFAVIATPKESGKRPGMLVLHGGGGRAEAEKAIAWAQRGYVAIAPDMPGIADPKKLTDSKGKWSSYKYGERRWVAEPDARASSLFDAVLAAMKSLYLLRAQPDVDPERIGVVGVSWGGFMTTMVCGLAGDQVRAGMALYGCGFMDRGSGRTQLDQMAAEEREKWLACLDPGRRASGVKAAFFHAAASNDFFGYPEAVQATLDAIPGEKNHVFAPNANHKIPVPGGSVFENSPREPFKPTAFQPYPTPTGGKANWLAMEVPYFDHHLKGVGQPFPKVRAARSGEARIARFEVASPHQITKAEIYWSKGAPAVMTQDEVKRREWFAVTARKTADSSYTAELPAEAAVWFALVSDDRPVSVSSDLVDVGSSSK